MLLVLGMSDFSKLKVISCLVVLQYGVLRSVIDFRPKCFSYITFNLLKFCHHPSTHSNSHEFSHFIQRGE